MRLARGPEGVLSRVRLILERFGDGRIFRLEPERRAFGADLLDKACVSSPVPRSRPRELSDGRGYR
jgi:hypothetical protein